ncbi:MAG: hypothetical protein KA974_06255 [Saprospiraceae bacterium]|nr:hypothetical protein [Saprospiraceae bacterium]MBP7699305.1 hypothetical protein [Saprospiraceae bacterium]
MKKVFLGLFAVAALVLTLTTQSCQSDPCKNKECGTHGDCFEGNCTCDVGYELDANGQCNTLSNLKFVGLYKVNETCPAAVPEYSSTVTASVSDITKINITNLGNYDCSTGDYIVSASINGKNVTIDSQVTCSTTFSGSGTYDATTNKMTIAYTATYNPGSGTVTDNCTAVFTKQ